MAPTIQASNIALAVRDSSAEQVTSQWQGPGNIMDVLLLVGADVIQAALAQISGSSLPTPVPFSFGWLTYSFSALVSVFGDSRLLPSADVSCFIINLRSKRSMENESWALGRLLRDFEYGYWMDSEIRGRHPTSFALCIAIYEAHPEVKAGKVIPGIGFYTGYFVALIQLCISAIPWILYRGSNYMVFVITAGGTMLAFAMASLPAWREERFACRTESRNTCILTRGNGARYVLVIKGNGIGLNLEDLASGARGGYGGRLTLQIAVACFTVLWVALLITVDGLKSYTWYLIAIGAIGSLHAVFLSRMRLRPEQVGIPLRYTGISIMEDRAMKTLFKAEDAMPGLGLALLDTYFPGDLRELERTIWDDKRATLGYRLCLEREHV